MHERILIITKDSPAGELVKRADNIYNIYPKHIPDNAIDENFSKAIIYGLNNAQIDYTLTTYQVQFTVVAKSYSDVREIILELKKLWNNKTFTDETGLGGLSSVVNNMVELGLDTETGMYLAAIDVTVKTALDI